jgi:predicted enzyme related to lactoylglutathione lyase
MKKLSLILITIVFLGINACDNPEDKKSEIQVESKIEVVQDTIPRVTGIGGIFFETENPGEVTNWYGKNLGLATDAYGSPFEFRNANRSDEINYLRWSPYTKESGMGAPGDNKFVINYRVNNIEGLVRKIEASGVKMLDTIATYPYGKFVHFMDPYGNKVELWEPVDEVLTQMGSKTTK